MIRRGPYKYSQADIPHMVSLRKKKFTYREIGRKFGISLERVRQLIIENQPSLIGIPVRYERIYCDYCHEMVHGDSHRRLKCCGALKCDVKRKRGIFLIRHKKRYEKLISMRNSGKTWFQIGSELFPGCRTKNSKCTIAQKFFLLYETGKSPYRRRGK